MDQRDGSERWIREMDQRDGLEGWIREMDQSDGSEGWIREMDQKGKDPGHSCALQTANHPQGQYEMAKSGIKTLKSIQQASPVSPQITNGNTTNHHCHHKSPLPPL
jgi:hypothetical protein